MVGWQFRRYWATVALFAQHWAPCQLYASTHSLLSNAKSHGIMSLELSALVNHSDYPAMLITALKLHLSLRDRFNNNYFQRETWHAEADDLAKFWLHNFDINLEKRGWVQSRNLNSTSCMSFGLSDVHVGYMTNGLHRIIILARLTIPGFDAMPWHNDFQRQQLSSRQKRVSMKAWTSMQ